VGSRSAGARRALTTRARRAALVAAALASLSGCGAPAWMREPMHRLGPTLEIVNSSGLAYRVTVSAALGVTVHPGQRTCVWAGAVNEVRTMEVVALASTTTYRTPPENLMNSSGWILEIGQLPKYDVLSLRPARPCRR